MLGNHEGQLQARYKQQQQKHEKQLTENIVRITVVKKRCHANVSMDPVKHLATKTQNLPVSTRSSNSR
jgi:hypothetical protein